jgi:hypothetical protein
MIPLSATDSIQIIIARQRISLIFFLTLYHYSHQQGHTLLARHSGSDAALLHTLLLQHSGIAPSPAQPLATSNAAPQAPAADSNRPRTDAEIEARCHELMNKHKVMLFMKGNPSSPKCGFSRQTVDILSDEEVRQGLKKVNDWPSKSSTSPSDTFAYEKLSPRLSSMANYSVD